MSVHYKFKNMINYDAIKFDGVYISAADLKAQIVQQKKLENSDLQIENEETGQVYSQDQMIPKNSNVIISRLPRANSNKKARTSSQPYQPRFNSTSNSGGSTGPISGSGSYHNHNNNSNHHHNHYNHHHNRYHNNNNNNNRNHYNSSNNNNGDAHPSTSTSSGHLNHRTDPVGGREAMELVSTKSMTEEEKIKYIQSQSTREFETTRYPRGRGRGVPGPGYTCRKCGIQGHSIYDCKISMHKRSSGIPRDFLVKVDSNEKGALMTPSGEYAVPYIDREAYSKPKIEKAPFFEDGPSEEPDR